jgi:hypothetical protein
MLKVIKTAKSTRSYASKTTSIYSWICGQKAHTTTLPLTEHNLDYAVKLNDERITGSFVTKMRKILSQGRLKKFYEQKWKTDYQTIM